MIICHPCRKVMRCYKTGSNYSFGNGHVYAGDTFICDTCGTQTAVCNSSAYRLLPEYEEEVRSELGEYFVDMNPIAEGDSHEG
jgi:primosomal protein N'